ncbi:LCP family protein required for cell wall assembly [Thermocatellispora tengchongensis]|uniref:LCP family protein required for cell wall assembly n=1 Tax=Thermocatellispora tengchongensis TaxID=1073253 RepID=A0A840PA13_9ACTN|nr:LCP family protein [Thermocatellispora tengchongensis]MBB5134763.1 LCP family protein required for cell wall assembly [Thermocatellispora tengchongensis]
MRDPAEESSGVRVGGDAYGGVRLNARRATRASKSARVRRRRLAVAGSLSGLVLMGSCASWALPNYAAGRIGKVDAGVTGSEPRGAMNILVVGVDKRDNLTRRQQNLLKLGRESGQRTDTMMVVHLSEDHSKVTVVSLPRDTWVTIPGKGQHKINSAYQFGGAKLAVKTVQNVTGLTINHYVEVNVLGFIDVVDSLGGVSVCTPVPINDPKTALTLQPGTYKLDGVKALAFARTRATARSDLDRIDRQQQVLSALLGQALSTGTLTNPAKLTSLVNSTLQTLTVDDALADDLLGLAGQLKDVSTDDVSFATVPIADPDYKTPTGESAVLWNTAAAKELFRRIAADEPLTKPAAKTPKPTPSTSKSSAPKLTVPPERIAIRVLNGTGITGRGAATKADLLSVGFQVPSDPGNTATPDYEKTVIRYGPGRRDSALTVSAALPGAELREVTTIGNRIEVIRGRQYGGVKKVTVKPETPATTGPSATPVPSAKTATENICKP